MAEETFKDAPPKDPTPAKKRGRPPSSSRTSLEGPLKAEFLFFGSMVAAVDPVCGGAIVAQAGEMAKALNVLAMEDRRVYRWLSAVSSVGGWGGVAIAALPVAQSVVGHHVFPAMARRAARRGEPEPEPEAPAYGPELEPEPVPASPNGPLVNRAEFAEPS